MNKTQAQTEARRLAEAQLVRYQLLFPETRLFFVDDETVWTYGDDEPTFETTVCVKPASNPDVWVAVLANGDETTVCVAPGTDVRVF